MAEYIVCALLSYLYIICRFGFYYLSLLFCRLFCSVLSCWRNWQKMCMRPNILHLFSAFYFVFLCAYRCCTLGCTIAMHIQYLISNVSLFGSIPRNRLWILSVSNLICCFVLSVFIRTHFIQNMPSNTPYSHGLINLWPKQYLHMISLQALWFSIIRCLIEHSNW